LPSLGLLKRFRHAFVRFLKPVDARFEDMAARLRSRATNCLEAQSSLLMSLLAHLHSSRKVVAVRLQSVEPMQLLEAPVNSRLSFLQTLETVLLILQTLETVLLILQTLETVLLILQTLDTVLLILQTLETVLLILQALETVLWILQTLETVLVILYSSLKGIQWCS